MEQNFNSPSAMESTVQMTPPPAAPPQMSSAPVVEPPVMINQAPPAQPQMASGGVTPSSSGNSTLSFLKEINWFEVSFMFLGALGMFSVISYYRFKRKEERVAFYDVQRQIDKLNQQIGNLQMATAQPTKNNGNTVSFA